MIDPIRYQRAEFELHQAAFEYARARELDRETPGLVIPSAESSYALARLIDAATAYEKEC